MNYGVNKKGILLIVAFCIASLSSWSQRVDTLCCGYPHAFQWQQAAAPAMLIGSGFTITATPWLHQHFDGSLHTWIQQDGHSRFEIEDYVQYAPLASVPLLKVCGLESRHNWRDIICLEGGSVALYFALSSSLKHIMGVERPYGGVYTSFPSGHTGTAFLGAELLRREYGSEYPGIAVAGYAVATGVGIMRIYNNRHWASDVLAGAGIGILSASLMYWLSPYLRF